jgi:hypothetical protein
MTSRQHSPFVHAFALILGVGASSCTFAVGCGPKNPPPVAQPEEPAKKPAGVHQMLPLTDRTVSNFNMSTDIGDQGILVLEIFRPRPELAELKIAGRIQRLAIEETRISQTTGGILLEEPLTQGRTFKGAFGTVTITETNQLVTVPAGTYAGCLTTVEESRDPPKRAVSTYCPGIGLVMLEVESFGEDSALVRTELTYHGPRVDLPKRHN